MSSFSINPDRAKTVASEEGALVRELSTIAVMISSARTGLNLGAAGPRIRSRINALSHNVNQESRAMGQMKRGLDSVTSQYLTTERKLASAEGKSGLIKSEDIGDFLDGLFDEAGWPDWVKVQRMAFCAAIPGLWSDFLNDPERFVKLRQQLQKHLKYERESHIEPPKASIKIIDAFHDSDLPDSNWMKKQADKLKKFNDKSKTQIAKGYFDENGVYHDVKDAKKDSKEEKAYDDVSSLDKVGTIISAGGSVSVSAWNTSGEGSAGIASGSYDVSVAKAEANADAYIGLYSYSADGKKHLTPGFGAEMGVGFSALTGSAEGRLGNEYFGAYGNLEGSVGKAEAKAAVNVGLVDKNGKVNPRAAVELSAEALAAEAKASGGVTLAGTDIGVTGGVNVGVGAHANFGFKDGKVSVDVGASLGVGVSLKLDMDFSGTVSAVSDIASSAWNGFKGLFK